MRPLVTDPRFLIGLSDRGAHVDQLCDAGYATHLLGTWVRERQALTLEAAVRRLTSEVAELFGIPDRGVLAPGRAADMVLFDPATVGDEIRSSCTTCPAAPSDWSRARAACTRRSSPAECCSATASTRARGPARCSVGPARIDSRNVSAIIRPYIFRPL